MIFFTNKIWLQTTTMDVLLGYYSFRNVVTAKTFRNVFSLNAPQHLTVCNFIVLSLADSDEQPCDATVFEMALM